MPIPPLKQALLWHCASLLHAARSGRSPPSPPASPLDPLDPLVPLVPLDPLVEPLVPLEPLVDPLVPLDPLVDPLVPLDPLVDPLVPLDPPPSSPLLPLLVPPVFVLPLQPAKARVIANAETRAGAIHVLMRPSLAEIGAWTGYTIVTPRFHQMPQFPEWERHSDFARACRVFRFRARVPRDDDA